MIKSIILDVDDTLLDFHKSERLALSETLIDLGITPSDETVSLYSRINREQWNALERGEVRREELLYRRFDLLFRELGVSASGTIAQSRYERYLSEQVHFVDGAKELLSLLFGKYKLYIASNGTAVVQDPRIEKSGIAPYFDGIFISERVGYNKPDLRFFDAVLRAMGEVKKDEIIIFGDSLTSDIFGGKNAGIKTCWFNPSKKKNESDIVPDYEVKNLLDFPKILDKIA